jgi:prepilin-type N-terminal cleavage/methylation domain-containing protein
MRRRGFTLIELLVVVSVVALLAALAVSAFRNALNMTAEARCASNLRQLAVVCFSYSGENNAELPVCNSANPGTFRFWIGDMLDPFMKGGGIPVDVWYCPALADTWSRIPERWMDPDTTAAEKYNEFYIGYFYIANPTESSFFKFTADIPTTSMDCTRNKELAFDLAITRRPAPADGASVLTWHTFAHYDEADPHTLQAVMGDGHVERRRVRELTNSYSFIGPADVFW